MYDEVDRAFSKLSSYGSRARCEGSGDKKRILVSFFAQADFTSSTSGPCADLFDLVFVQYSPADVKRNVKAKSLFVTDIPLFLTETQVHSAFSRYGSVVRCNLSLWNHYYTAIVQFSTADLIAQFDDTWAILCLSNSLRVCPASYSKVQRDARRQHVAVLAGIPKNIKADLADIANQISAKAINIPLSYTSYKPKPYVYMNFFSQETLNSALELTVSFKNRGLTWHSSNDVKNLCHITGPQKGCAKDQSSQRSSSRSRFHSSPFRSARNNGNRSNDIRQPKQGYILVTHSSAGPSSSRTEQSQPIRQPLITLTNPGITPEEVAALRQQILDLSTTIHSLDERVDWFSVGLVKSVLVRF
ncbi:hypothetical protein GLOIN_2v1785090 [Rhizophagus irregularis DAOM 181602=DAOM 197198]|nr:hypothetical protein GLOIN_2v1785090 [Rhizophagus irregularis DAOM 181602=DAOM 197198]